MGKFKDFLFPGLDFGHKTEKDNEKDNYKKNEKQKQKKKINLLAIIGFILGLLSIFLGFGIIPLLAIIFSAIGLKWKDKRILAIIGLVLGIVYFTVNLYQYGHLDFGSRISEKQMIKLDACTDSCGSGLFNSGVKSCKAKCREEYSITLEEYNEWKEKSK